MRFSCLIALLSLVACGDDSTLPIMDSGPELDAAAPDVFDAGAPNVFDAGPPEPSRIFGACEVDSQCPGEDAYCRQATDGFSGGLCSVACVDRRPCDDGVNFHWCLEANDREGMACEPKCLNSLDCGRGDDFVCIEIDDRINDFDPPVRGGRCVGYCDEDSDCGAGAECNEQAAVCVPEGSTPTEGAVTNEACESDGQCLSGDCTQVVDDGSLTGEVGGSCRSRCTIPSGFQSSNFYLGDALPTTHCPNDGDICIPSGDLSAGSEGSCYAPCGMDGECRPGRQCLRRIAGKRFDNGICIPVDCRSDACPAGHECVEVGAGDNMTGRCRPE
ncbi:MAG: hypothetical protein ACI9KE_005425 [Polyangiales bacterium]|jgi:hypothetical protein